MPDLVRFEARGRVGIVTLDRPRARNAINGEVANGIEAAIDRLEDDEQLWVGILAAETGDQTEPVFCAGADLKAVHDGRGAELTTDRGGFAGIAERVRTKPLIVAVDGLATAGGCEIALACDLVVATTRSAFGLAEVKRNLVASAGGLYRLPRAVGQATAMEAILTGEPIPATRAHELGLVSRLVEPGAALDAALDLANAIARNAPLAVRASRKVVLAAATENDTTLRSMTDDASRLVMRSDDLQEGLAAFVEKREPRWQGR